MGREAPHRSPLPGTVLAGRFRVERLIGQGAISVVYEATDLSLKRRVAVKLLAPQYALDAEQRERFLREGRAAASVANEHVARLIDVQTLEDGGPFLVLEYLEGIPLDEILEREGPPAVDVALDWLLQAIDGIAEAHARGLVHRDIKPANLFLAERPNRPSIVKVLDFGTVKDTTRRTQITQTGATLGSPAYMAPEQVRAEETIDVRADVWALGVTLYELVTGDLPFNGASIAAVLSAILKDPPPPLRRARSDVPEGLEAIVLRCLEKERARRYANASELHVALARLRAGMPKTTRATRTIRLGHASAPTFDEASAVRQRPHVVLTPSPAQPAPISSRRRVFGLAMLAGALFAGSVFGVVAFVRRKAPPATAQSAAPAITDPTPPDLGPLPVAPVTGVPSASHAPASGTASGKRESPLVSSIAFDLKHYDTVPPVATYNEEIAAEMLQCVRAVGCAGPGGALVKLNTEGVTGVGPTVMYDQTTKSSSRDLETCAGGSAYPCIRKVMADHKVHANCTDGPGCIAVVMVTVK